MAKPEGSTSENRPPEPGEYNTEEEFEAAMMQWVFGKPVNRPSAPEPEDSDYPGDESYKDTDSSEENRSGQTQNKKPSSTPESSSHGSPGAGADANANDDARKKQLKQEEGIIYLYATVSQHGLSYTAFLGGISITLMVLVMSTPGNFDIPFLNAIIYYPHILALWAATTGFLFILSSVGFLIFSIFTGATKDILKNYTITEKLAMISTSESGSGLHFYMFVLGICMIIAFLLLVVFLPLLLLPFFWIGAILLGALEFIVIYIAVNKLFSSRKESPPDAGVGMRFR